MALAATRQTWAVGVAMALALLCACDRDGASAPGANGDAGRKRADGIVTVSGDDAIAERLTWRSPVVVLDDADIPAARKRAAAALAAGRLYEDADAAIPLYLALLARDSYDGPAKTGLARALIRLRKAGDDALRASGDEAEALQRAQAIAAVMRSVGIERVDDGAGYLARLDRAERLWELNEAAERALADGRLGEAGEGALPLFRQALALQPEQPRATQGVAAVESALIRRAEESAERTDFDEAERWLAKAAMVRSDRSDPACADRAPARRGA